MAITPLKGTFPEIISNLIESGAVIHLLPPRTKALTKKGWSTAYKAVEDRADYRKDLIDAWRGRDKRAGNPDNPDNEFNWAVQTGYASKCGGQYLHILDLDCKNPDLLDEAIAKLREIVPEIDTLPTVKTGSGGRHYYFFSDKVWATRKPFFKHTVDGEKLYAFDFLGEGSYAVCPPSIHDKVAARYEWLVPIDFDVVDMECPPSISDATLLKFTHEAGSEGSGREEVIDAPPPGKPPKAPKAPKAPKTVDPEAAAEETPASEEDDDYEVDLAYLEWSLAGAKQILGEGYTVTADDLLKRKGPSKGACGILGACPTPLLPHEWRSRFNIDIPDRTGWQISDIKSVLSQMYDKSAWDDYQFWQKLTFALHYETEGSDEGFELSCELASVSQKFRRADQKQIWKNARGLVRNPATLQTILMRSGVLVASDYFEEQEIVDETEQIAREHLNVTINMKGPNTIKSDAFNVRLAIENSAALRGCFALDEITNTVLVVKRPVVIGPYLKSPVYKPFAGSCWKIHGGEPKVFGPEHLHEIVVYLNAEQPLGGWGISSPKTADIEGAVKAVASEKLINPMVDMWSKNLPEWDGEKRLEKLFAEYIGLAPTPLRREVGVKWLTGQATRILQPGYPLDIVPVLEGGQGVRKSSFCKILGGAWYKSLAIADHEDKELINLLRGASVIELEELKGIRSTSDEATKRMLTIQKLNARESFKKDSSELLARHVFIGTVNQSEYLKDVTGNRRWFPVGRIEKVIDTDKLREQLPQIMAEAWQYATEVLDEYPVLGTVVGHAPAPFFTFSAEASAEAEARQRGANLATAEEDDLAVAIRGELDEGAWKFRNRISAKMIYDKFIKGYQRRELNTSENQRIARVMDQLEEDWPRSSDATRCEGALTRFVWWRKSAGKGAPEVATDAIFDEQEESNVIGFPKKK